jgi:serine/alanine adding enzyme
MRVVTNLDRDLWKKFVDENRQANIFHTPEMWRVFAQAKGYRPNVWAGLGADGQILAMFLPIQITVLDWPFLRKLATRAVVYGSVLCESTAEGHEGLDLLLRTYNQKMKNRMLFTELRNLSDLGELQLVLSKNGLAYEEHLNFLIDLTLPKSEIWNAIRSNAQRNVRKARKSGVVIEAVEDMDGVAAAYAVLQKVYRRIQVPLPDQSLFQAAFDIMKPKGMFKIFLAKVKGVEIGALTLLLYKGVITYWYTGTLREFSSYRASDLLVWHALEWGSENGFHTFDFGGGGKPGEEYGVRDFKAKFGGSQVNYGRNVHVHAPLRLRASQFGYQLLRRFL